MGLDINVTTILAIPLQEGDLLRQGKISGDTVWYPRNTVVAHKLDLAVDDVLDDDLRYILADRDGVTIHEDVSLWSAGGSIFLGMKIVPEVLPDVEAAIRHIRDALASLGVPEADKRKVQLTIKAELD